MRNFILSNTEGNENYITDTLTVSFGNETLANIYGAGFHYPDF
jgi:hypothetical protein